MINPVSLKQITGKNFEPVDMAKELYCQLMKKLTEPADKLMELYNTHLYKLNKKVMFKKDVVKFETVIKGVSDEGRLITVDAFVREFDFGEVEWVI